MARILVVGPGAIGIQLAVRLHRAGHDVRVAVRDRAASRRLPQPLVAIDADGTRHEADVPPVHKVGGATGQDGLLLATKCGDAPAALDAWMPALGATGFAVAMQNGLMGDDLAAIAGDRLVECTVAFPATLRGPGVSELTGPGGLIVGAWPDLRMTAATPVEAAAHVLAEAHPTRVHQNMLGVKWTKLLINSAITGLGAMTGRPLGDLIQDRRARGTFLHIVTEGAAAGAAAGVTFEKVAGFHPRLATVGRPHRLGLALRHLLLRLLGRRYRRQRSSSLQSLERGRQTEVHHLNGRIVTEAEAHGLDAPVNAAVVRTVASIEGGEARPAPGHLDGLPVRFL